MVYAVDFDGTLCQDCYPKIGKPNLAMIERLRTLRKKGHKLILWTCRNGQFLSDAVTFAAKYGLYFDAINENLPEVLALWGGKDSRKISADVYIDDRSQLPD